VTTSSRSRRGEQGSAAVFALVLIGLLVTVGLVGATVASMLVGQRRAASGADLAALAGASAAQQGKPGCAAVADLAAANDVRLVLCNTRGDVVTVEVSTEVASVLGSSWTVRSRARAGPAP